MTHNNSKPVAQNTHSQTWWTPRRMKLAGLGGLVGGFGGLLSSFGGFSIAGLSIGSTGMGIGPGAVGMLYPVWHVLFAVALLAANARYGSRYGRGGHSIAIVLALSLVSYAGSVIVLVAGRTMIGDLLLPIGALTGTAYMVIRLVGTLYGISLWRHEDVSRLTAGLFIVLFPAVFILGPLTQLGFPGVLIAAPLDLAFISLGYDLWAVDLKSSAGRVEARA